MSILGTAMPNSSKPAMAMALLTRWPMTKDDKEEDELNYAPLPHLSSSSSSSPSLPPQSLFSCPASSTFPAKAAAAASSFLRGSPLPASPRAAARVPRSLLSPLARPGSGGEGRRRTWGVMAPGDRYARRRPSAHLLHPPPPPVLVEPAPAPHPKRFRSIASPVIVIIVPGGAALVALFFGVNPHGKDRHQLREDHDHRHAYVRPPRQG
jgi:hypothetical protein